MFELTIITILCAIIMGVLYVYRMMMKTKGKLFKVESHDRVHYDYNYSDPNTNFNTTFTYHPGDLRQRNNLHESSRLPRPSIVHKATSTTQNTAEYNGSSSSKHVNIQPINTHNKVSYPDNNNNVHNASPSKQQQKKEGTSLSSSPHKGNSDLATAVTGSNMRTISMGLIGSDPLISVKFYPSLEPSPDITDNTHNHYDKNKDKSIDSTCTNNNRSPTKHHYHQHDKSHTQWSTYTNDDTTNTTTTRDSSYLSSHTINAPHINAHTHAHAHAPGAGAGAGACADGGGGSSSTSSHMNRPHEETYIIKREDIVFDMMIGGGGFGQVWRGTWLGTPVAVKILHPSCQHELQNQKLIQTFYDEISILSHIRHPNICLFMGACIQPSEHAIVTEYVVRGSLWDALRQDVTLLFPTEYMSLSLHWPYWAIRKVIEGTCMGLLYLHKHHPIIIHRDLKSANILLTESFQVKICDFGLAKLRTLSQTMTANVGTAQWMAPEVISGSTYNESVDIYSLGLIAWELYTGKCPFEHLNTSQIIAAVVMRNERPPLYPSFSPEHIYLLQNCWHQNPAQRWSADTILGYLPTAFP